MPRTVVMAKCAHRSIVGDCLAHVDTETGGVLAGFAVGEELVVPFSIPAGPAAKRSLVHFTPDSIWQQVLLDFLHARFGADFLGDWHRHPHHFDRPSRQDLHTARHIVTDLQWNQPVAVFPIAVIHRNDVRLRAYLMRRETLAFEEIPIEIVPDADPRMTAALIGTDAPTIGDDRAPAHASGRKPGGHRAGRILRRAAAYLRHLSTR